MGTGFGLSRSCNFGIRSFVGSLHYVRSSMVTLSERTGTLLFGRKTWSLQLSNGLQIEDRPVLALGRTYHSKSHGNFYRSHDSNQLGTRRPLYPHSTQAGFVLVHALTLIPLLLVVITVAAGTQFAMKKKLEAQSLCVKSGLDLQKDLTKPLSQLLKLNPQARQLRAQRANADRAYFSALASANPYALAAARAWRTAVILAQNALRAEQQRLLASARISRVRSHQKLVADSRQPKVESKTYYHRSLAVYPTPQSSPSPDYLTEPNFARLQQQRFSFEVDLTPGFWHAQKFKQTTTCSVSLNGKEGSWYPKIIAASALSK